MKGGVALGQRWRFFCLVFAFFFLAGSGAAWAQGAPRVSAGAALLMEPGSGQVLFAKGAAARRHPASTTKILTALLALELCAPGERVVVAPGAAGLEGMTIGLRPGETFLLADLVKGALIQSGNDAAAALAYHVAGSNAFFARLMEVKAQTLGALRSSFRNPHGLTAREHLTTAYDLALITRYALRNRAFSETVATKTAVISPLRGGAPVLLVNTNRLLWQDGSCPVFSGVKTGTTAAAGPCLVARAECEGRTLLSVVLGSGNRWADTVALIDYGFRECAWVPLARRREVLLRVPVRRGRDLLVVPVGVRSDFVFPVPREELAFLERQLEVKSELEAPLPAGARVGELRCYFREHLLARVPVVTLAPAE